MAVPTISFVSPSKGPTAGGSLVAITGDGFRLPTTPPPGYVFGSNGDFLRSVAVTFGGVAALDVRVLKTSLLTCRTPESEPTPAKIDLVVQNLDDDGEPIVGEAATAVKAFSFARPRLDGANDQDLTRLVRAVVLMLKRNIIANVVILTSTDYDPKTAESEVDIDFIEPAEVPAIVLVGPDLTENRFYSENELGVDDETAPPNVFIRRESRTHDVTFQIIGVTDNSEEMLNMLAVVELMFHRIKFISLPRKASTPNDLVRFELDIAPNGSMKNISRPNRNNLRAFSGSFLVRGFQHDDLPDFPNDLAMQEDGNVESIIVEAAEQVGQSFIIGASPGDSGAEG